MSGEKRKGDFPNRKFVDSWTDKYCFINHNDRIICLLCNSTVAVAKEYNVKRHYETKHIAFSSIQGYERSVKIKHLKKSLINQTSYFQKQTSELDSCVEVTLNIAQLIAKRGKPFTDGDFVKDCLLIASEKLCPETTNKFKNLSLNRMTVQRRIQQLSEDIVDQVKLAASHFEYFSLAADESTDITSTAQLLVFIRGINKDFCITEELLGMYPMKGQTTGKELFHSLLELCNGAALNMDKIVSITTDGARSMTGGIIGMITLLKEHLGEREMELLQYHCIIHQQNLCAKELGYEQLMKRVCEAINFIRSSALRHREFKEFLAEFEDIPSDVVYYTEVRWLSRGKALKHFIELFDKIITFLKEHGRETRRLEEASFQCDLAFLTDITSHLNELNIKLQGKNQFIFQLVNNVNAFKRKLVLFQQQLREKNFAHFPYCKKMKEKFPKMKVDYEDQVKILINSFHDRFLDFEKCHCQIELFSNPFTVDVNLAPENAQLELIDLQSSGFHKNEFKEKSLLEFYRNLPNEFSYLKRNASMYATMFGSTYICEQSFSMMTVNKSKTRNRLTDENLSAVLHIATATLEPNITKIASKIQSQPSH